MGKSYITQFLLSAKLANDYASTFEKGAEIVNEFGDTLRDIERQSSEVNTYLTQADAIDSLTRAIERQKKVVEKFNAQKDSTQSAKDYKAWSKEVDALEKLTAKLKAATTEHDKLRTAIMAEEYLGQEKAILSYTKTIEQNGEATAEQSVKLALLKTSHEQLRAELEAEGVDIDKLIASDEELSTATEDLAEETANAAEQSEMLGEQNETTTATLQSMYDVIISSGVLQAVGKLKDAFMSCVSASASFEQAMSNVKAISQGTTSEMEELTEKAEQLGLETVYTATEAANAMSYMAQAGWSTEEILSGVDAVTDLAAAGSLDLATAASITADTLAGFGLEASEAAHVADVLAQTAANSNTSIELMGDTFENCASVAGSLGYSIEDVSTMMGLMANAGVKNGKAGTALKNMFTGLLDSVTLTGAAFGEIEYSAVNADGTMKPLSQTMDELREIFEQMTPAEKNLNAENIAGLRGFNGLLAIINASDEAYSGLYDSIVNADGAAKQMAETKLDNYAGSVELLSDAFDALKRSVGDIFLPVLRRLVDDTTVMMSQMQWVTEHCPGVVKVIGYLTAGVGAFVAVIASWKAISAIKNLIAGLGTIGTLSAGPVVAGVVAATVALVALVTSIKEAYEESHKLQIEAEKLTEEYEESVEATEEQAAISKIYAEHLEELLDIQNKDEAQIARINTLVGLLNDANADLNLSYDEEADKLSVATSEIYKYIDALEAEAKQEYALEKAKGMYSLAAEAELSASEMQTKQEEYLAKVSSYDENSWWDGIKKFFYAYTHAFGYDEDIDNYNALAEEYTEEAEKYVKYAERYSEQAESYGAHEVTDSTINNNQGGTTITNNNDVTVNVEGGSSSSAQDIANAFIDVINGQSQVAFAR